MIKILSPPDRLCSIRLHVLAHGILLACLYPIIVFAQPELPDLKPVRFERIDGLSHNTVRTILQDRRGFMWIGTSDGLNRHDGYSFAVYDLQAATPSMTTDNVVQTLYEDRDGFLWIGTSWGLFRLDVRSDSVTYYDLGSYTAGTPAAGVKSVYQDRTDAIWIGTDHGLYRYVEHEDRFRAYLYDPDDPTSIPGSQVYGGIWEDRTGDLWIAFGLDAMLARYDRSGDRFERVQIPGVMRDAITGINPSPERTLVTITGDVHGFFDPVTRSFSPVLPGMPDQGQQLLLRRAHINSTLVARNGWVWIGTYRGVYLLDHNYELRRHSLLNPLGGDGLSNYVLTCIEDRDGAIWVGTRNGLYRYDLHAKPFEHVALDPSDIRSTAGQAVMGIAEDHEGNVWMGTFGGGLYRRNLRTGEALHFRHDPSNPSSLCEDEIWTVHHDGRGRIWVGGNNTVCFIDLETLQFTWIKNLSIPRSGFSLPTDAIATDADGTVWLGVSEGLIRLDSTTGTNALHARRYLGPDIQAVHLDRSGRLWVGTNRSDGRNLHLYDPIADDFATYSVSATGEGVWYIFDDVDGAVWLASPSGLARFDPGAGESKPFSSEAGLPGSAVNAVLKDGDGRLWMSTNSGLVRFDPSRPPGLQVRLFDESDGLEIAEFNRRAAIRSRDGSFFFGGINGATRFRPEAILDNPIAPPVHLTSVQIASDDTTRSIRAANLERLVLTYSDHSVVFEYVGLGYTSPHKNRYAYRLDGFDDGWVDAGAQRLARYANLPPGSYTFRVRASNNDGVWNEEGAALAVVVLPPWWRTRIAYALYVLMLLGALYGTVRWRSKRLEWRNLELSRLVDERTIEVERQKAQIEVQAERLRELDELKSSFFANISHEFRTPLTLTFGPLDDLLSGRITSLDDAMPHLARARRNGQRLLRLINQLLDLSRIDAGTLSMDIHAYDLVDFIRQRVAAFESLAMARGLSLHFEADVPEFTHSFDAEKIETVVLNLLSNAVKFTPPGGSIIVAVRPGADGHAVLSIRDTGPGIASEHLSRLFDRFYQVDGSSTRAREGTGIGLALVKQLVELHGGGIDVESALGEGTTFTVTLPAGRVDVIVENAVAPPRIPEEEILLAELHQAGGVGDAPNDAAAGESDTIVLVVEDNADMRAYIRTHLADTYFVEEAENGQMGLALAAELVPDIIVSDVMMPGLDGFGLVAALKSDARTSHIPVVLLTAKADADSRIAGLECGADAYLAKPFNAAELRARVYNLIEQRRRLQSIYSRKVLAQSPLEMGLPSVDAAFLERVRAAVEAHLSDASFGVDALADAANMSRRQLHRKLEGLLGEAPGSLIRRFRMERAATLLENGAASVKEVSYQVGFRSTSSFRDAFRETFGVSPSQFDGDAQA